MSSDTLHAGDSASQIKEYWDDLLAFIDEKHVIPVVGPELVKCFTNSRGGRDVSPPEDPRRSLRSGGVA